jgi:hypothetical protein
MKKLKKSLKPLLNEEGTSKLIDAELDSEESGRGLFL